MINYLDRILGTKINTRTLMVSTPHNYVQETIIILKHHWHSKCRSFVLIKSKKLASHLDHIANAAPLLTGMTTLTTVNAHSRLVT